MWEFSVCPCFQKTPLIKKECHLLIHHASSIMMDDHPWWMIIHHGSSCIIIGNSQWFMVMKDSWYWSSMMQNDPWCIMTHDSWPTFFFDQGVGPKNLMARNSPEMSKSKAGTKIVAVRALISPTIAFCTEFRRGSNRDDGILPNHRKSSIFDRFFYRLLLYFWQFLGWP